MLKWIIHLIETFLTENFDVTQANGLYLLYPVVGIFLTGLFVRYIVRDDISHGVDEDTLCHIPQAGTHQTSQRLVVGRGQWHYHRVWRVCGG